MTFEELQAKYNELFEIADTLCDQMLDMPAGCDACRLYNWNPHYKIYYEKTTPTGIENKILTYDTDEETEAIYLFNEETLKLNVRITKIELDDSDCGCDFRNLTKLLDKPNEE